ncbi:MAG: family 1 glycosylhydrolase [Candidatus Sericytochromatia bacterium]|nr:family 1 glycosylhydrolase [Candidatus Sericytochromatia bacterium]
MPATQSLVPLLRRLAPFAALLAAACGVAPGRSLLATDVAQVATRASNGFLWGVSTAAYQWEGNNDQTQWLAFELAGKTEERAGAAADGWNRYREDIALAKGMGLTAFRTSLDWGRIEPEEGRIDAQAVARYHDMLSAMREAGLTPIVTLMHFSYPKWIEQRYGGWENRRSVYAFERFAGFVAREFGRDIEWYLTFNEPNVFLGGSYVTGAIAPGRKDVGRGLLAARNFVLAHQAAFKAIHAADPVARVSFNNYAAAYSLSLKAQPEPSTDIPEDLGKDWMFNAQRPAGNKAKWLDYVALDYYCRWRIGPGFQIKPAWQWEVYPQGLHHAVRNYHKWTGLPVLVAENGFATDDLKPRDDNWTREAYLVQHVAQLEKVRAEGVPVLGYVHWSITDNWEWGSYRPRFGLYSVDCRNADYRRVPTEAAGIYARIATQGGTDAAMRNRYRGPSGL